MADDLDAFLEDPTLSREATFSPVGGASSIIRVVFAIDMEDVSLGGGVTPSSSRIVIGARATDVPGIKQKDVLTVDGVDYVVQYANADETGWMNVIAAKGL
jgi:hypothetical protein